MLKLYLLQNSKCILDKTKLRWYINVIFISRMSLNKSLSIPEYLKKKFTGGTEMSVSYFECVRQLPKYQFFFEGRNDDLNNVIFLTQMLL